MNEKAKELLKKIESRLLKDRELSEGRYCTYMKLVHQALAALEPCQVRGGSCVCQQCGKEYEIDLNIPDYWWEKIKPKDKPKGGGLLCPACIVQHLSSYKEAVCLYLKVDTAKQPSPNCPPKPEPPSTN